MGLSEEKVASCLMEAKGNVPMAETLYIAKFGCNGFKCKTCPITLVCNHNVTNAQSAAILVLGEIERRAEIADKKES